MEGVEIVCVGILVDIEQDKLFLYILGLGSRWRLETHGSLTVLRARRNNVGEVRRK